MGVGFLFQMGPKVLMLLSKCTWVDGVLIEINNGVFSFCELGGVLNAYDNGLWVLMSLHKGS
jgi:hypothetical protein